MPYLYIFDSRSSIFFCFFFTDTATTEIYTLSLHDALPIWRSLLWFRGSRRLCCWGCGRGFGWSRRRRGLLSSRLRRLGDRKSTRLNSSHRCISYAVFCLKKKKKRKQEEHRQ